MKFQLFILTPLGVREDSAIWDLFKKKMVAMNYKINIEGSYFVQFII